MCGFWGEAGQILARTIVTVSGSHWQQTNDTLCSHPVRRIRNTHTYMIYIVPMKVTSNYTTVCARKNLYYLTYIPLSSMQHRGIDLAVEQS